MKLWKNKKINLKGKNKNKNIQAKSIHQWRRNFNHNYVKFTKNQGDFIKPLKTSPIRYYKNFYNLNIVIKNQLKPTIVFNTRKKKIVNNHYLSIFINIKFMKKIHYYLKIIKNRIRSFIKKYELNKIK